MNLLSFKLNIVLGCSLAWDSGMRLNWTSLSNFWRGTCAVLITAVSQNMQCHRKTACWKASEYLRGCKWYMASGPLTQLHSECTTLFSHVSPSSIGPKHRGNPAEIILLSYSLLSILTCYTSSIETLEKRGEKRKEKTTNPPHTFPNNSILKGFCENCIMFIEIAQFSWYSHIQSILKKAWIPHMEVQPPTLAAFKCHKIKFLAPSSLE